VEGSCEYIEYAVVDSRQVAVLWLEGRGRSTVKEAYYEVLHRASDEEASCELTSWIRVLLEKLINSHSAS
jgi:hypothetical protein